MITSDSNQKLISARRKCYIALLLLGTLIGCAFYYYEKNYLSVVIDILGIKFHPNFLLYIASLFILGSIIQKYYEKVFKGAVVSTFLNDTLGKTVYKPSDKLHVDTLRNSGLFQYFNSDWGSDWFQTKYGKATLTAANCQLKSIESRGDKGVRVRNIFSGAVVNLKLSKGFGTKLLVIERHWGSDFFEILTTQSIGGTALERVKVIAPDFNRAFRVWSDDQITSRKILNPAFMEKMTKLAKETPFTLSINNNDILIAIEQEMKFTPRLFLFPLREEKARFEHLSRSLNLILSVLNTLQLEDKVK
ncbi:MAG: hypothetical protein CMF48_04290 [Legionellales bacterium]|nr:hypothetical protein [Legionellales bacterium]|tara:strand:+ start:148 stop:1059 length:912 start_codon:yes stop_codon:yes gene_type:complete